MRTAICSGSFDPITLGHLDIIERACNLFDKVIVLILINPTKTPLFSVEERIDFIKRTTKHLENVEVDYHSGLLVDYVKEHDIDAIVRGLRAVSDFEHEFQMSLINKKLYDGAETIFFTTALNYMYLSSSIVKNICENGGDISGFVPEEIVADIINKYKKLGEG